MLARNPKCPAVRMGSTRICCFLKFNTSFPLLIQENFKINFTLGMEEHSGKHLQFSSGPFPNDNHFFRRQYQFARYCTDISCLLLSTFVSLSSRLRLSSARRSLSSLLFRLSSSACSELGTFFFMGLFSGELIGLVLTGLVFTAFTVALLCFFSEKGTTMAGKINIYLTHIIL